MFPEILWGLPLLIAAVLLFLRDKRKPDVIQPRLCPSCGLRPDQCICFGGCCPA